MLHPLHSVSQWADGIRRINGHRFLDNNGPCIHFLLPSQKDQLREDGPELLLTKSCTLQYVLILRSYFMKIHLHKVDAAPRDSHPGRQHLFMGIVTFKGGKQGGMDVQQVPSPLLHKLPCSDKKPQFIHTTCMLNQTNTNIQPEKNPVHKKALIIKKLTTTKSFPWFYLLWPVGWWTYQTESSWSRPDRRSPPPPSSDTCPPPGQTPPDSRTPCDLWPVNKESGQNRGIQEKCQKFSTVSIYFTKGKGGEG